MTESTPENHERFRSWPPSKLGALVALGLAALAWGCSKEAEVPEPRSDEPTPQVEAPAEPPPPAEEVAEAPSAEPEAPPPPHPGPWFWIARTSAGIYQEPRANRDSKIGYVQRGGKLPVLAETVEGKDCSKGWYRVVGGGYICSMVGTTDENDKIAKFAPRQPNLDDILPYTYVRNAHNGTPLYRSLPSKAQMLEYEPYLNGNKAKDAKAADTKAKTADAKTDTKAKTDTDAKAADAKAADAKTDTKLAKTGSSSTAQAAAPDITTAATAAPGPAPKPAPEEAAPEELALEPAPEEPPKPWWQQENVKDRLHEIKLDHLAEEADGVLAKRMVRGFYVAVDSTFKWGGRNWYKTTKGLLAPSERFWGAAKSKFEGVELGDDAFQLPVAWVYGGRKQSTTYLIDEETQRVTAKGTVAKFKAIQLTGKQVKIAKRTYHETAEGTWVRGDQIRLTTPGPRPEEVGDDERWIDVDLSQQTLVAFQGDRPVFATLVSSGRESKVKSKDHRTPRGAWRVREKHVTGTMDGDGTAAGDLPYSIEDVPYVMYYQGSYALHAAFWHENYGVQMSHGCLNLSPLDAKRLFFWADPQIPEGWHGMWSNEDQKGTLVVAHD